MTERKTYNYILQQFLSLALLVIIYNGCSNQTKEKNEVLNFSSIQFDNELIMFQTDDKFGEWGGDTYYLKMYRNSKSKQLMIDYIEYRGKAGPPEPPNPKSKEQVNWFSGKPIQFEKKKLLATKELLMLISNSIQQLISARINNAENIAMSGIQNHIMCSDSSILISDYPSINWDKFHKTIDMIRNE